MLLGKLPAPAAIPALCRGLRTCRRGVAAIEFAFVSSILVILLVNVVDFSFLIWSQMQCDNAAEVGAQAAFATCAGGQLPATTNCSNLDSAVTTAVQSTSLGSAVTVVGGAPIETYYCTNGTALQSVGSYSSPPSPYDCASAGNANATPGDYITVTVNYSYSPIFAGISLISAQTLTGSGMQRLQ